MTQHNDAHRLRHMLAHTQEAIELTKGRSRDDLDRDRLLNLALVRLLEVVGEAATRIPEAVRQQLPQVPWSSIIGLRNRLIHGYDEVDFDILWDIIADDLPPLAEQLREHIEEIENG